MSGENGRGLPLVGVIAACLFLGVVLMLPALLTGAVISSDSVNYLSIAENAVRHGRLVNFAGRVELVHPFGYSLAMMPFASLGIPVQWAALVVNWLSLAVVGMCAWLLARRATGANDWRTLAAALLAESNPLLFAFTNTLLSEAMCSALVMLFLWLCARARDEERLRNVLLVSACALALWFTRYAGLAVVVGAGACLRRWRSRAFAILPSTVLSVGGYVLTRLMRPYFVPHGIRIANLLNGVAALASVYGVVAVALILYLAVKDWEFPITRMLTLAVVIYAGGITAMAAWQNFNPTLDSRLYVPISAAATLLIITLTLRRLPGLAPYLMVSMAAIATLPTYAAGWRELGNPDGKMLNSRVYRNSQFMDAVRALPDSVTVYCNNPAALWLYTRRRNVRAIPDTISDRSRGHGAMSTPMDGPARTGGVMLWLARGDPWYRQPADFKDIAERASDGGYVGARDSSGVMFWIAKPAPVPESQRQPH